MYREAMGGMLCFAQYRTKKLLVDPTYFILKENYWRLEGHAGSNSGE